MLKILELLFFIQRISVIIMKELHNPQIILI